MMTSAINLDPLARVLTERMLNCMIEGIAIGLFAWLLLQIAGRRNSSTRFAVWFSALLAIAVLPLIGSNSSPASISGATSTFTLPRSWALDIFIVWAAIASMALLRVGLGLWQLRKLRASCMTIDVATLDPALQKTLQDAQAERAVTLCQSEQLRVPTAIGFIRPLVVLPAWAMQELSTAELNSVLIHELAHLRRRDDWTNLAQQILKALWFFHPAVWWIESKLALEREMACDDAVLAATANPRGYAQCLISLAEKSFMRRGLALAQAAVDRVRQTSLRVSQILDARRPGATRVWKPALYSVGGFSVMCLVALAHAPQLVAFRDQAPAMESSIPSGTSFSRTESNLLTGGMFATPVSLRTKNTSPTRAKALLHHDNRKQNSRNALKASLLAPDVALRAHVKPGASIPLANILAQNPERASVPLLSSNIEITNIASANENQAASTPQTILVVMRSEQYFQDGMQWQVRVWQLTVFDSGRALANVRIPARKI